MSRLRVLSEDEIYTRLYSKEPGSSVSVVGSERDRPRIAEALRDRLDEETAGAELGEEAA